jgi:hypothetical protein
VGARPLRSLNSAARSPSIDRVNDYWSFGAGLLEPDDSVKGYDVDASDGHAGKVAWASYKPGESYLVVNHFHHGRFGHFVVPAGVVASIDRERRRLALTVPVSAVEAAPEHEPPEGPLDPAYVHALTLAAYGNPD